MELEQFISILDNREQYPIEQLQWQKIEESYQAVRQYINKEKADLIYGIDTGFGPHAFSANERLQNQLNLIYHLDVKEEPVLTDYESRSIYLARLHSLAFGSSGVSPKLIRKMQSFIKKQIFPAIPQKGSLGASGDLIPLAQIANFLTGNGLCFYQGEIQSTANIFSSEQISTYRFSAKEAISLVNGTSFMTGLSILHWEQANRILHICEWLMVYATSFLEVFATAFHPQLARLKSHLSQFEVSKRMWPYIRKNTRCKKSGQRIQDIYSIRCFPQIYSGIYDMFSFAKKMIVNEFNSVSDNPVYDFEEKIFIEGGNFYGSQISFATDILSLGLTKLAIWQERFLQFFLNPHQNENRFPLSLSSQPGKNMGLAGLGILATSITAEIRQQSTPCSTMSMPSNSDNQDIVPMGSLGVLRNRELLSKSMTLLSCLFRVVAEAEYHSCKIRKTEFDKKFYEVFYSNLRPLEQDRSVNEEVKQLEEKLKLKINFSYLKEVYFSHST